MKNRFFHKKWPLPLLTTTATAFLFPLFSSGTRSATLFLEKTLFDQNVPFALELAAACQHPDAQWLAEACAGKDVTTEEDAKRVFSVLAQNDARSLCFAWMLGDRRDLTSLRHIAELGFAFGYAWLAGRTRDEEGFKFAQLAAAQGKRDGRFVFFSSFSSCPFFGLR
jgi:predicted transcriptional regulator